MTFPGKIERFSPVFQRNFLGHYLVHFDPAVVEIAEGAFERVNLRKGAFNRQFFPKNVKRVDGNRGLFRVHAIDQNGAASPDKLGRFLGNRGCSGRFDNRVESFRTDLAQAFSMDFGIVAMQGNNLISGELGYQIEFRAGGRCDHEIGRPVQLQQLGHYLSSWPCTKKQNVAPRLQIEHLNAMHGTRSRFYHDRFARGEILDRKNPVGLDLQILRKSAVQSHTIAAHFFAKQVIASHTIKAFAAGHIAVADHALSFFKAVSMRSHIDNFSGKLVAWDQWKTGAKLALMNMQIGAADSAGLYLDQHFIAFHFRIGYIAVSKISGRIVGDRFHDGRNERREDVTLRPQKVQTSS